MQLHDSFDIVGILNIKLINEYGIILLDKNIPNQICDGACDLIAFWDANSGWEFTSFSYVGIGTLSGGKTQTSTHLENQAARKLCDTIAQGSAANSNVVTKIAAFGASYGAIAIREAGMFNHISAGAMFAYQDFAVVNKAASDIFQVTWTVRYGPVQS